MKNNWLLGSRQEIEDILRSSTRFNLSKAINTPLMASLIGQLRRSVYSSLRASLYPPYVIVHDHQLEHARKQDLEVRHVY